MDFCHRYVDYGTQFVPTKQRRTGRLLDAEILAACGPISEPGSK